MKRHLYALFPILVLALTLTSCGSPTISNNPGTKTSSATRFCARTPSFTQTSTIEAIPTPTTHTGTAKPYSDIVAGLKQFRPDYNEPSYTTERGKINSYFREQLEGKQVTAWEGWVVSTGVEAIRSMEMKLSLGSQSDDNPTNTDPFRDTVLISMQDPFAPIAPPISTPERGVLEIEPPRIALMGLAQASSQPICIGQKVRFNGNVAEAPEIIYSRGDFIVLAKTATVIDASASESTTPEDLADLRIELRRIPGWSGPDYHVTLFGDGTVLFEGRHNTLVNDFKISKVTEEKVRQLISEFDKSGFATMSETDFAKYEMSDSPSARITLYHQGKRKSIYHYFGNNVPAEALIQLENKIDEILQTDQWVGKH